MNNLRKFANEADYSAATLNYPAVSWIASGDTVKYDKEGAITDVMMSFHSESAGDDIVLWSDNASPFSPYFNYIAVNNSLVSNPNSTHVLVGASQANTDYLVKYNITSDVTEDWFNGELGTPYTTVEILIPSQITQVDYLPSNDIDALVVLATTPPYLSANYSDIGADAVYVPDESVSAYSSAGVWQDFASVNKIHPLSQYSGNLPV